MVFRRVGVEFGAVPASQPYHTVAAEVGTRPVVGHDAGQVGRIVEHGIEIVRLGSGVGQEQVVPDFVYKGIHGRFEQHEAALVTSRARDVDRGAVDLPKSGGTLQSPSDAANVVEMNDGDSVRRAVECVQVPS